MKISKDIIEHVANLARLNLTEEEKSALASDMEQIISYVDKLNELDTSNVEPTNHVIPITNVFREDKAEASYPREKILANAPSSQDGCFKVPKIVE
ncbi:MAG TPA: Asp-tRNA(Asn)/Glu-tRNA(Gln) amidotransferase subunit GatC [Acetivibrio clariflavus]|nr:Asp-tRNA(Asn)/Glu-tRNA(Gln) amidotransferase subunit GatC [Acetivibrio clariflavus]HPU42358.1 Asp-tRNA(Asn)/Glu-tRNA(Gln) amidotransferase subunit GatC [Acetivibrio clariflavus]